MKNNFIHGITNLLLISFTFSNNFRILFRKPMFPTMSKKMITQFSQLFFRLCQNNGNLFFHNSNFILHIMLQNLDQTKPNKDKQNFCLFGFMKIALFIILEMNLVASWQSPGFPSLLLLDHETQIQSLGRNR